MAYSDPSIRTYVEKRFPKASSREHDLLIEDWVSKPKAAHGIADDFERRIGSLHGRHVLDAGSGNGGISIEFAKRGATVVGVEIERELVEIAEAAAAEVQVHPTFVRYDGGTLPFPDNTFDSAFSASVLEHVDDPVGYLSEILRVLRPGGTLYLAFPNRLNPKETHTGLWFLTYLPAPVARAYPRLMGRNPLEDNNLHFYTYWDLLRFLAQSAHKTKAWHIRAETGRAASWWKRGVKAFFRALGIPHQALLPHVMLVLEATPRHP